MAIRAFRFSKGSRAKLQRSAVVAGYFLALSVVMTWPQAIALHWVPFHHDVLFSIWRLAWTSHALSNGLPLFDANIFYPADNTFAYSDATLLQGVLATGLIQLRWSPVVAYNLLILASFIGCGAGAYLWARSLGLSLSAGLLAGTVFSTAPMRFGHYMHLEILWTQWIPLAFWACRRLVDVGDRRAAAYLGAFITLQALSALYAFIFLITALPVYLLTIVWLERWRPDQRALLAVGTAALVSMAIVGAYAAPFLANAASLGPRSLTDVREYSATIASFFSAPPDNRLYGWTAKWGGPELELSSGLTPLVLAGVAFTHLSRRLWSAVAVTLVGFALTLGLNGPLFGLLRDHVFGYSGLRVPARAAMIVHCGLAILAAAGFDRLRRTWSARTSGIAFTVVLLALAAEYSTRIALRELPRRPSGYAAWLRSQPDGVVAEFPMPALSTLPGDEASVQYESIYHWRKLVNGYSGYYPLSYRELVHACTDWSVACKTILRERGVTTVVFHVGARGEIGSRVTIDRLENDTELEPVLTAPALWDQVRVYRLRPGH